MGTRGTSGYSVANTYRSARQLHGFDDIVENLSQPDKVLIPIMKKHGITEIIHSEGPTVWDHVDRSVQAVDELDVSEKDRNLLKLAMLYHDYGKTIVVHQEENLSRTDERAREGRFHTAMYGHQSEGLDFVESELRKKKLSQKDIEEVLFMVRNHMEFRLCKEPPKRVADVLGEEDPYRRLNLLYYTVWCDARATESIKLEDGKLVKEDMSDRVPEDFVEKAWNIYLPEQANRNEKKKQAEIQQRIKEAFGEEKPGHYFMALGMKGSEIGEAMKRVEKMAKKGLTPSQIKVKVDKEFRR